MVELFQDLLPWLLAFYLFDGVANVRRAQLLLCAAWPGRYALQGPGLRLASLGPGADVYCGADAPFLPGVKALHLRSGPEGYQAVTLSPAEVEEVAWPAPGRITRERSKLLLEGKAVWTAPSEAQAETQVLQLRALAALPEAERAKALPAHAATRFAVGAVRRLHRRLRPLLWGLRLLSTLVFLGWFVALPLIVFGPRDGLRWLPVTLLELVVLHLSLLGLAATVLWRGGQRGMMSGVLLPVALFPPAGARGLAHVTAALHAGQETHAVALALASKRALPTLWRRRLYRARLEQKAFEGHDAAAYLDGVVKALEKAGRKLPVERVQPEGKDAAAYCPNCEQQYRAGIAECSDCRLPLRKLGRA